MNETISLALLQNVLNTQKSLITIFKGSKLFIANKAFLSFFRASSVEDFNSSFRSFTDSLVPHPSYFNRESLVEGENWFETIAKLNEEDRIISMLTPDYEPHAFSVEVGQNVEEYTVVTFVDVTHTLIKRIMIENNATLDTQSGAYDRKYFLHIANNYDDAAVFNEKIIGIIKIVLNEESSTDGLKAFVQTMKRSIREDDMLVRWDTKDFLLVCLVDNAAKVNLIVSKIKSIGSINAKITSVSQMQEESVSKLIKRLD